MAKMAVDIASQHSKAEVGIVFIHGAGLKAGIWEKVSEGLAFPCLLAEYPSREETSEARKSLALQDYAAHLVKQIAAWPVERVVLVAHSIGGVVALQVAEALKDRIAGLVGVGAVIPARGGSFLSALPWPQRTIMGMVLRMLGTKPPESAIRQGLCHDLPADKADEIVNGFVPEAVRVYKDRVGAAVPDVPRWYVKLELDRELSPALQDRMAANMGAQQVVHVPSGHLPMLSKPVELQRQLAAFVEQVTADRKSLSR